MIKVRACREMPTETNLFHATEVGVSLGRVMS